MSVKTVTLDNPILTGKNKDIEIKTLSIRKPLAGDLRGVKLIHFAETDVDSLIKVLPRVTTPTVTENELVGLEIGDLLKLTEAVSSFLIPNSETSDEKTETASPESPTK